MVRDGAVLYHLETFENFDSSEIYCGMWIPFIVMLGVARYCVVTGRDLTTLCLHVDLKNLVRSPPFCLFSSTVLVIVI